MPEPNFEPGESLVWLDSITTYGQIVRRMVAFRGMQNNLCVVAFGLKADGTGNENLYSVQPAELSRPQTPVLVPAVVRAEAPPPVALELRRESLAKAFAAYRESEEAVSTAQFLLDRAWLRLEEVQNHLREFRNLEQQAVDAALHDLRAVNGNTPYPRPREDDDELYSNRDRAQRECHTAEAAYETLVRELSDMKTISEDRLRLVQKAAGFVLAGIIEREVQVLSEIEDYAIQRRAELRAAATLWISDQPVPVGEVANVVLNTFPFDLQDPMGQRMQLHEQRQQPFNDVYVKLVSGDIEADLDYRN